MLKVFKQTCFSSTANQLAKPRGHKNSGSTTSAPTNTLPSKQTPLRYEDLQDFIKCYNPQNRHDRQETEHFKPFTYQELTQRDKTNLDIFWLKDESLEDTENLPLPNVIARDITENLQSALEQFNSIAEDLEEDKTQ